MRVYTRILPTRQWRLPPQGNDGAGRATLGGGRRSPSIEPTPPVLATRGPPREEAACGCQARTLASRRPLRRQAALTYRRGRRTSRSILDEAGRFPILVQHHKGFRLDAAGRGAGHRADGVGRADRGGPRHPEHRIGSMNHCRDLLCPSRSPGSCRPSGIGSRRAERGCRPLCTARRVRSAQNRFPRQRQRTTCAAIRGGQLPEAAWAAISVGLRSTEGSVGSGG
jgi:hypothetical protein